MLQPKRTEFEYSSAIVQKKMREYIPLQLLLFLGKFSFSKIDSLVIANMLGSQALGAFSAYQTCYSFLMLATVLIGSGISIVYSNALGENHEESVNETKYAILILQLLLTAILAILQFPLFSLYLIPLHLDGVTEELCRQYAASMFFAVIFDTWVTLWLSEANADGKVKTVSAITAFSGILNIVFDLIFIKGFDLGIRGAGYSSTLVYFISFVFLLLYLKKKTRLLSFRKVPCLKRIIFLIKSGAPEMYSSLLQVGFNYLMMWAILQCIGDSGLAVKAVCSFCYGLAMCFINPINSVMKQFAGMYHASGNKKGLFMLTERLSRISIVIAAVIWAVMTAFPQTVFSVFGYQTVTADEIAMLRIYLICVFIDLSIEVLNQYFSSTCQVKLVFLKNTIERVTEALAVVVVVFWIGGITVFALYSVQSVVSLSFVLIAYLKQKNAARDELSNSRENRLYFSVSHGNVSKLTEQIDERLIRYGMERRAVNRITLVVEEFVMYVLRNNPDRQIDMDICIQMNADRASMLFWDNGCPTEIRAEEIRDQDISEETMLVSVAEEIRYSRVFDLNYYTFDLPIDRVP